MDNQEILSIYRTYSRRLYNTCLRILGRTGDAEEVMQDSIIRFVRFAESSSETLAPPQVQAWLSRTALRLSIDRLRERGRDKLFKESYTDLLPDDESDEDEREEDERLEDITLEAEKVRRAISRLKDPYGLVLGLLLVEGLSYEEISSYTGIVTSTLRSHFRRGKQQLLSLLEKDKFNDYSG